MEAIIRNRISPATCVSDGVARIIAESDERLDRIFDDVARRTELIRNLKKKLQHSSSILHRRESKLEEKINQGRDLQSELQKLVSEKDNLKVALEQKSESLAKAQDLVQLKDKEIQDILTKMSKLENNLNTMYHRMSDRDKQLNDARNQILTYSHCPDCAWMRDYIHRLEYQLQHYRYPEAASPYHYSNDILNSTPNYSNNNRWIDPRYHRSSNSSSPLRNTSDSQQRAQQRSGYTKPKRSESYWRQQAASRQRMQEFRNASLALSPIKEDTEETSVPESNNGLNTNSAHSSDKSLMSASVLGETTRQATDSEQQNATSNRLYSQNSPGSNSPSSLSSDSCHYFTVRTEKNPTSTKKENNSMTYLHIASGDQQTVGSKNCSSPSSPKKLINASKASNLPESERTVIEFSQGDAPFKPLTSTSTRPSDTSILHRLAVTNARSSPDLSLHNKPFTTARSFPFLNGSVTSSGSVASTESAASDTTGCSSDSGLAHQAERTKRVKARRTKRSRKSSKYITFRDHKIDVTRFSTPEFRQIMWSLCVDPSSADEFLNFLAAHAKRLQSDPQWSEKHSLGTPEEWLALKGSY